MIHHNIVPGMIRILTLDYFTNADPRSFHIRRLGTNSAGNRHTGSYTYEEAGVLAFTGLFAALLECPDDPMGIVRRPQERPGRFHCFWAVISFAAREYGASEA